MGRMRITKFGHACVRVEHEGSVVVVDPGGFTGADAVEGADAVLVTHEHPDHLNLDHLRAASAPVYTIAAVAGKVRDEDEALGERVTVVRPGDTLDVAGMSVRVVGERHAVIHASLPRFDNSGFVLTAGQTSVFHPGDSLESPGLPVDVLCAPVAGPWVKLGEVMDFVRAVAARHTLAIHDVPASEIGLGMVDPRLADYLEPVGGRYTRLRPGQDLDL
jgi:L-ascorbate metabolism protein UlaG (beta-lactamase superfamily)